MKKKKIKVHVQMYACVIDTAFISTNKKVYSLTDFIWVAILVMLSAKSRAFPQRVLIKPKYWY